MFKFILISKDSQCIQLEYHRLTFKQRIKVFDCLNLESLDFFILKLMEIATTTKSDAYISNLYSVVRDENGNVKLDCPAIGKQFSAVQHREPVEIRGRDIGALVIRKILQSESDFCFGEGGGGTWSDGKLVTRIGKNNGSVFSDSNVSPNEDVFLRRAMPTQITKKGLSK
ncbi:putative FAD dependent protein [Helianthus annuus]|nr:putative FAD dependent protein [Helianthus annuus]